MTYIPRVSLVVIHRRAGSKIGDLLRSVEPLAIGHPELREVVLVDTGPDDQDDASKEAREIIGGYASIKTRTANYRCPEEWEFEGQRCIGNFAAARNYAHSLASPLFEYQMSLDADDVWIGDSLSFLVREPASRHFVTYEYGGDLVHQRARVWQNDREWRWIGALHESRESEKQGSMSAVRPSDAFVRHHGDIEQSKRRNAVLLDRLMLKTDVDPMVRAAYVPVLRERGELERAQRLAAELFGKYPTIDLGVRAAIMSAELCKEMGDTGGGLRQLGVAAAYNPGVAELLVELAHFHEEEGNTKQAQFYYDSAYFGEGSAFSEWFYHPAERVAQRNRAAVFYLTGAGDLEKAAKLASHPIDLAVKEIEGRNEAARAVEQLVEFLSERGERDRIELLLDYVAPKALWPVGLYQEAFETMDSAPQVTLEDCPELELDPIVGHPPVRGERGRIDIVAPGIVEWGPQLVNQKALGGSEQAVLYLAPKLVELGYEVHVWAALMPGETIEKGVQWHYFEEFNPYDTRRDAVIVWRSLDALDLIGVRSYPVIYWAHDVPHPERKEDYAKADMILALSEFHVGLFKEMGLEAYRFTNGIDVEKITAIQGRVKRDYKQVIYCSAATRGLMTLLRMWPYVLEEVPDARLVVTYPLELLDHPKTPRRVRAMKEPLLAELDALKDSIDSYPQGLPHSGYLRELARSSVWAYPTIFPEISCIVAMEAQALGVWPLTTASGALDETVFGGIVFDALPCSFSDEEHRTGEVTSFPDEIHLKFVDKLVELLKNPPDEQARAKLGQEARRRYDWGVAAVEMKAAIDQAKETKKWQPASGIWEVTRRKSVASR